MFCMHCGQRVEPDDRFCPACGGTIEAEPTPTPAPQTPAARAPRPPAPQPSPATAAPASSNRLKWTLGCGCLGLFVLFVVLFCIAGMAGLLKPLGNDIDLPWF